VTSDLSEIVWTLLLGVFAALLLFWAVKKGLFKIEKKPAPFPHIQGVELISVFAIYIAGLFILGLLFFKLFHLIFNSLPETEREVIALNWSQVATFFFIAFFLYLYCKRRNREKMKLIWKSSTGKSSIFSDILAGICMWVLAFPIAIFVANSVELITYFVTKNVSQDQVAVRYFKLSMGYPHLILLSSLLIVFLAPCIEELLFRGFLQNYLKRYVGAKSAILLTAFSFALFHYGSSQGSGNISLLLSLFVFAWFLGFIYEKRGSLFSSIALHMTFNALSVVGLIMDKGLK